MEGAQAIARLGQGDAGELEALACRHPVQAQRTAFLVVLDRALGEEVVQAAFSGAGLLDGYPAMGPFRQNSVPCRYGQALGR